MVTEARKSQRLKDLLSYKGEKKGTPASQKENPPGSQLGGVVMSSSLLSLVDLWVYKSQDCFN